MYVKRPMCLISAAFAMLLFIFVKIFPPDVSPNALYCDGKTVSVTGKIYKKEIKNEKLRLYLKNIDNLGSVIAITNLASTEFDTTQIGSTVKIDGKFELYDEAENDGQFDQRAYYIIRGIEGKIVNAKIVEKSISYNAFENFLCNTSYMAKKVFATYMNEDDAAIMQAIVLGDRTEVDEETKDLYQNAGISHILSLSGLHIAAVGLFILKMLKKTGLPSWFASILAMFIMMSYAILTGMSVSTQRALFMFLLAIIADLIGRTYDLLSAAALSSVYILIKNPYYILDTGFLLSFTAIVAIGVVYPAFSEAFTEVDIIKKSEKNGCSDARKRVDKCVLNIINGVIASLSISLTSLPIVAFSYYRVSRYSFIANLIILPLMGTLLGSGFAGLFTGMCQYTKMATDIITVGRLSAYGSFIIFKISNVILKTYNKVSLFVASLYGNTMVTGKPLLWQSIVYYVLLCIAVLLCYFRKDIRKGFLSKKTTGNIIVLIILCAAVTILTYHNREELEIRNLSVGQGDCAVITGKSIPNIVIDGGSTDIKNVGKYRIVPALLANGISEIDYMFISHLDADHYNGLMEILKNDTCKIKVKRIVISAQAGTGDAEEADKLAELERVATQAKCKIYRMGKGDDIVMGDIHITCLSPKKTGAIERNESVDSNDESLVLRIASEKNNFTAIFTGDISSDIEKQLDIKEINCDYLKVAHHGSKYSSSEYFLRNVSPLISVISVGKDNSYGHPHDETLERLDKFANDAGVFRTDDGGQITIIAGKNITVRQFKGRKP